MMLTLVRGRSAKEDALFRRAWGREPMPSYVRLTTRLLRHWLALTEAGL